MRKVSFSIFIQAPKMRVWETLWSEQTYSQWTKVFCEGSFVITDWQEGSKVHFLAPDGNGMYSVIDKKVENDFISFVHLGDLKNKEEQTPQENWKGNFENYTLTEVENGTMLTADVNSLDEFVGFFDSTFPQALQNVKELAEKRTSVTVEAEINAPVEKVWAYWTEPAHIQNWCFASDDWCAPHATNDLRAGGTFLTRMEAKDGSFGFDFEGTYLAVRENEYIEYALADARKVCISFEKKGESCKVVETFDAENANPIEMQRAGWQMIMNNFKKYVEENS